MRKYLIDGPVFTGEDISPDTRTSLAIGLACAALSAVATLAVMDTNNTDVEQAPVVTEAPFNDD